MIIPGIGSCCTDRGQSEADAGIPGLAPLINQAQASRTRMMRRAADAARLRRSIASRSELVPDNAVGINAVGIKVELGEPALARSMLQLHGDHPGDFTTILRMACCVIRPIAGVARSWH